MSGTGIPAAPTRRITATIEGQTLWRWTSATISRNLRDISGKFDLEYRDSGREAQVFFPDLDPAPYFPVVKAGQKCTIAIDGTTVMTGWIVVAEGNVDGQRAYAHISGYDVTGDLVDCAAAPNGPVEYRNLNTLQIAQAICKPFGISVRADVPITGTFPVFGIQVDETALSAIERAARQDALLVVSDGVGGLLLTRGGSTRAPAPLQRPGNILSGGYRYDWTQRFSDYYVKGQTNQTVQRKGRTAPMNAHLDPSGEAAPGTAPPATSSGPIAADPTSGPTITESTSTVMTGHVVDPEITRYRPSVRQVRTQSGAATVQQQADWTLRVQKGMSQTLTYRVLDWRAGTANALWLPNALSRVTDGYSDLDKDMLISGVSYVYNAQGEATDLELAGPTAFDRIDEPAGDSRYITRRTPRSFGPTRQG
jgi:prophage tail gpP-like protein